MTSVCASERLRYEILPWVAMVLFQDGIYVIEEFPKHPAAKKAVRRYTSLMKFSYGWLWPSSKTAFTQSKNQTLGNS